MSAKEFHDAIHSQRAEIGKALVEAGMKKT